MKILISKRNPQVRIIAPEIYHDKALGYYVAFDKFDDPLIEEKEEYWTLVEEEPQLPANLDEAEEEYEAQIYFETVEKLENTRAAFKAGARWMAEQIKGGSK